MQDDADDDLPLITACPHCGHAATVQSIDTLSPQVCTKCQQIHVVTLKMENSVDSDDAQTEHDLLPAESSQVILGRITRYRVTKILGTGSFGVVYKAWDPRLHRWVAIKVPKLATQKKQVVADFLREARTAARLRHPRIVSVYDAETASGRPFIVSEFVEGETLATQLLNGSITPRRAARVVYELAVALHYAHEQGIVHRDIKPGNVMIDDRGMPRLMDFGLAQQATSISDAMDGKIVGTPAYMSPEMAGGKHRLAGAISDQYSLGVVFFECLVGQRPFDERSLQVLLRRIANEQVPRPKDLFSAVPVELDEICSRMTALSPTERFQDLGAVAKQLSAFLKPVTDAAINTTSTKTLLSHLNSTRGKVATGSIISVVTIIVLVIIFNRPAAIEQSSSNSELLAKDSETPPATDQAEQAAPVQALPAPTVRQSDLAADAPSIIATRPDLPKMDLLDEPPVDALAAVESAHKTVAAAVDVGIAELKPTFPAFIVEADLMNAFRVEFKTLLSAGFPEKGRVDDKAFSTVMRQFAILKKLAPREPRVPYAVAVILRSYFPGRDVKKQDLPNELELLRDSQRVGGYPFTPGYLSEVDYWLRQSNPTPKPELIRDTLASIAVTVGTQAAWPDASEKRRVSHWLGKLFGYFSSGVSGRSGYDQTIITSQEAVESTLPAQLRQEFVTTVLSTKARIAHEIAMTEGKGQNAVIERIEKNTEFIAKAIDEKEGVTDKLKMEKMEGEELEKWYENQSKTFTEEFGKLQNQFAALELQAAPYQRDYAIALAEVHRASANFTKLQSDINGGFVADPADLPAAQQAVTTAHERAETIRLPLLAIYAKMQQVNANGLALGDKVIKAQNIYRQKKGKNLQVMTKLQRDLKSLDQSVNGATAKAPKPPENVLRNLRAVKELKYWVHWSSIDAKNWLLESMGQLTVEPH